ncbi:protein maelstrom homolog isoform X2 [Daktulosphaira vitifoliae]|nr:protein maelstrom homolog isoform X2 [Daktulosphaira vitifoliae]
MAPKKKVINAYSIFMTETQKKLAAQGIPMSMAGLATYCKSDWEKMPEQIKAKYKARAKEIKHSYKAEKMTSTGEKVNDVISRDRENNAQFNAMYSYIEELVKLHLDYLSKQTFIFIHVNSYSCEKENFYFPAEIAMVEFSLERGLIRRFHQLIGFDKIRTKAPPAPSADINMHAKANHKIDTFTRLPNNYTDVLLKIIGFIINKEVDESVLNDPTLDMPPIFTAHNRNEVSSLSTTNLSLFQLYNSAVEYAGRDDFDKLLKVYHLDKLLKELKNTCYGSKNPNSNIEAIPSVAMASEFLNKDMSNTIKSIGCNFHEKHESAHVCSNYYVCKWIYIFSTHCCSYFGIKLISGCHFDFDLLKSDSSLEEEIDKLNITHDDYFSSYKPEKYPQEFTASMFPTLGGVSPKVFIESKWNKPESKSDATCVNITNEISSFPPLGGNVQHPSSAPNSWRTNAYRGRGINPVQSNINAGQNKNNIFKSKGRGVQPNH